MYNLNSYFKNKEKNLFKDDLITLASNNDINKRINNLINNLELCIQGDLPLSLLPPTQLLT